mmetsp:Transcript_39945/g.76411  ORF Transcript_39945/g.76411 Transcript_39945/m.76411 type:complete len:211 (+) Transcript_39945:2428-3060(+)
MLINFDDQLRGREDHRCLRRPAHCSCTKMLLVYSYIILIILDFFSFGDLGVCGSVFRALLHLQDLHANDKLGNICFDSVMRCQVPKESTCPSSALDTASTRRCTHTTMLATNADNWSHSYTSSSPGPSIESDQEYSDSGVSGTTADRISNSRFASVASKQWPQLQASGFSVNSQTGTWCSMFSADASTLWSPSWFFGNHSVSLRDESVRN